MKIAKNFKKIVACLLAFAVIFTCIGSALAVSAEETRVVTNGNGNATDVGIWYTPYNCTEFFAHRFADPNSNPVGYRGLLPDGSYGIPFAGDVDIMDFYIEQMAKAGIDFVMFDITNGGLTEDIEYGWGADNEYAGNRWQVVYTKLFAERLSEWNDTHSWKIRYAISVGTYEEICAGYESAGYVAEVQAQGVLDLFVNNEVYGDDYYYFDGKPFITLFDWTCVATNTTAVMEYIYNVENSALSQFTVRSSSVGQAGTYSWNNNTNENGGSVYDAEVVTVCPGHALAAATEPSNSRREGATYQENWATVLDADVTPRVVMISSFNDYMENTAVFVTNTDNCVEEHAEEKWTSPYQYWDMTVDYIADLQAKNAAAGFAVATPSTSFDNLALTATVTTNSTNLDGAGPLTQINNGSLGGRSLTYKSQVNDGSGLVKINFDLGTAKTINTVNLYADNCEAVKYGFKDIAVEVEVDGAWKRVAELHNLTVTDKELVPVYFEAVKATKVRVICNTNNQASSTYASFAEIEIYNNPSVEAKDYTGIQKATVAGTEIAGSNSVNYALASQGSTLSTNTSIRSNTATGTNMWSIQRVNDGDNSTYYYGYVSGNAGVNYSRYPYIQVDFASAKVINQVVFAACNSGEQKFFNDYAVDVQLTDGTWKRVATRHYSVEGKIVTYNGQKVNFYFEDVEAKAFRITCDTQNCQSVLNGGDANGISQIFSCSEVQAYYNSAVASYTGLAKPTDSNIPGIKSDNYALTATVSTTHWNLDAAGPLTVINDGARTGRSLTYSNQNAAYQTSIFFDFAEAKTINNIDLYSDGTEMKYAFKDLAIDATLADGSVKRLAELHNVEITALAQLVSVYFEPVTVTRVTITVDSSNQENTTYASFAEVEIYNNSKDAEYTGIQAAPENATFAVPKTVNYAKNGTATDIFPAGYGGGSACLVDGSTTNSTRSAHTFGTGENLYYQIMFADGAAVINTVNLVWDTLEAPDKNYSKTDYAIEVITESGEYYLVAEVHLAEKIAMTTANAYVNSLIAFAPVKAAGIRIWFNVGSGGLVSLYEIESYFDAGVTEEDYTGITKTDVYVTSTPAIPTGIVSGNLAAGQKVTTSNTNWSLFAGTYPVSNLIDGVHGQADTAACALANYINGQASFTVNFDKAYTVNKVVTKLSAHEADARPDEYVIEAKTTDGWVRVAVLAATQSAGHVSDTFYFEAIECTAIRVIANNKLNAASSPNFRINEIEIYYDSNITEDMYTGVTSTLDAAYTAGIQGDVDGDTWVDAVDLTFALNWYTRARERIANNEAIMDTNRDGKYDIRDYIYLVEVIATRDFTLMG